MAGREVDVSPPPFILAFCPGILTENDRNWAETMKRMVRAAFPRAVIIELEYFGLPLPWYQTRFANKRLAQNLAGRLGRARRLHGYHVPLYIWGHSNGCCIALDALKVCPAVAARCLILMAAACHASVKRNGLRALYKAGAVARAVAWHNEGDVAIGVFANLANWLSLGWTWGLCGAIGFQGVRKGEPFENFLDPLPGHSDNFQPYRIKETFRLLCHQSGITK